jgi:hypothetical protein
MSTEKLTAVEFKIVLGDSVNSGQISSLEIMKLNPLRMTIVSGKKTFLSFYILNVRFLSKFSNFGFQIVAGNAIGEDFASRVFNCHVGDLPRGFFYTYAILWSLEHSIV